MIPAGRTLQGFPALHYEFIHGPIGNVIAGWITFAAIFAICLYGAIRVPRDMSPKYTARAILAVTLALTLSVKIAVGPTVAGFGTTTRAEAPMTAFLERHGFNVGAPLPNIDPPMIRRRTRIALIG